MALNSVNTNIGAMVALQSMNRTTDALDTTQKRISTGFRVADAKDDGAAFAVAQTVRADIAGLTSANEQLGGVKGILETTMSALTQASGMMTEINKVLVKLADETVVGQDRANYQASFNQKVDQVNRFLADATYNGRALIVTDENAATSITGVRNENAETFTVANTAGAGLTFDTEVNLTASGTNTTAGAAFGFSASQAGLTDAAGVLTAAGARSLMTGTPTVTVRANGTGTATAAKSFDTIMSNINSALNKYGNDSNYVNSQIAYNKDKMDAMESGLGALIDADLAKESAKLQSLQIRQQLGTQALGIANQAPQTLLSLFR